MFWAPSLLTFQKVKNHEKGNAERGTREIGGRRRTKHIERALGCPRLFVQRRRPQVNGQIETGLRTAASWPREVHRACMMALISEVVSKTPCTRARAGNCELERARPAGACSGNFRKSMSVTSGKQATRAHGPGKPPVVVTWKTEKSAQGQTLLAGDQIDSWLCLGCPCTRTDETIMTQVKEIKAIQRGSPSTIRGGVPPCQSANLPLDAAQKFFFIEKDYHSSGRQLSLSLCLSS